MKKFLTMALMASLSIPCWAIDWSATDNLAKGASVIVSSKDNEASSITDGNDGSRWQAFPATHDKTHDWVIIDLGENKEFTDIEISWESSHASLYSVYTSTTPFEYTESQDADPAYKTLNVIPAPEDALVSGGQAEDGNYVESLQFPATQNARYILIYCNEYCNNGNAYGASIFEVRLANIQGRNEVSALKVETASVLAGEKVTVSVVPVNSADEPLALDLISNISLTCGKDGVVNIEEKGNGEFEVEGLVPGVYTLTARAQYDSTEVTGSAQIQVNYNWNVSTTIVDLKGKIVAARWLESSDVTENGAENSIDGDKTTYYQYNGDWGGGDAWVVVDLGKDYVIDAIGAYYPEGAQGVFKFSYGATDAVLPATQGADYKWTDDNALQGWVTSPSFTRLPENIATYVLPQPATVRFIAVRDVDNPGGKPKVGEIYLSGVAFENPEPAAISVNLSAGGLFPEEKAELTYTVYDQFGTEFTLTEDPEVLVSENLTYSDGEITAVKVGPYEITVKIGEIEGSIKGYVADVENYCMDGAIITSDTNAANPQYVIDGGSNPDSNGNLFEVVVNEPKGEATHWIMAKLSRPYNLDLIAVNWEGACPEDYDVYVGETEESLAKLYSITGHTQNNWKDRFSGEEMDNVQVIKIVTTKNATGYGIKLYEIKAYGEQSNPSVATGVSLEVNKDYVANDEEVTLSGSVLDQFGGELEGDVTFYVDGEALEGNTFTPENIGKVKVVAKSGDLTSDEVVINVIADKANKLSNDAYSATYNDEGISLANGLAFEADENDEFSPLEISFDTPVYFDLIRLDWEAACPSALKITAQYNFENETEIVNYTDRNFVAGADPDDRLIQGTSQSMQEVGFDYVHNTNLAGVTKLTIQPLGRDHVYNIWLKGIHLYGTEDDSSVAVEGFTDGNALVDVVTLQGVVVKRSVKAEKALEGLPKGIYIVGGKKVSL